MIGSIRGVLDKVLSKLDFEKVDDRVNWGGGFLDKVLCHMGFGDVRKVL